MTETESLRQRWHANKDRPAWVRRHSDELESATDLTIPDALPDVEDWLARKKGVVTRRLKNRTTDTDDEDETQEEN